MTNPSPESPSEFRLVLAGETLPPSVLEHIGFLEVSESVGDLARAVVRLSAGGFSSSARLGSAQGPSTPIELGQDLEIALGDGGKEHVVFRGVVAELVLTRERGALPGLEIRGQARELAATGNDAEPVVSLSLREVYALHLNRRRSIDAAGGPLEQLEGHVLIPGDSSLRIDSRVQLEGDDEGLRGPHPLSRLVHRLTPEGFESELSVGSQPEPISPASSAPEVRPANAAIGSKAPETIQLRDATGNALTMDSSGITLEAAKGLPIRLSTQSGAIELDGKEIRAASSTQISIQANAGLSLNSNSQLEMQGMDVSLKGMAMATVQAPMVKIN